MEEEKFKIDESSFKIEGDDEFNREEVWKNPVDKMVLNDMLDYTWLYKQPFYKWLYGDKLVIFEL